VNRALCVVVGVGLLVVAWAVHDGRLDAGNAWPAGWVAAHPDPRDLGPDGEVIHGGERAQEWQLDASLLALGLGVACLAAAARGGRDETDGVPGLRALGAGAVAIALVSAAAALDDVRLRAGRDAWTFGDDALRSVAGPHTDTLRAWRDELPEDAAVLVVGTRDFVLNLVAWSLHPRAVHPVVVSVPADMNGAALLELAREHTAGRDAPGGRWLVDLDALAGASDRPALQRVDAP
jgi:hypothetical protein